MFVFWASIAKCIRIYSYRSGGIEDDHVRHFHYHFHLVRNIYVWFLNPYSWFRTETYRITNELKWTICELLVFEGKFSFSIQNVDDWGTSSMANMERMAKVLSEKKRKLEIIKLHVDTSFIFHQQGSILFEYIYKLLMSITNNDHILYLLNLRQRVVIVVGLSCIRVHTYRWKRMWW